MRTIMSTESVELPVKAEELIEGKWLNLLLVSKKLATYETDNSVVGKSMRTRFYNSTNGDKYTVEMKGGMKCIDVSSPMKVNNASLVLSFKRI